MREQSGSSLPFLGGFWFRAPSFLMHALISDEPEDLREAMTRLDAGGPWPKELRAELDRLYDFRTLYDEETLADLDEEKRRAVLDCEWKWTLELAHKLYGYVPEALIGHMPLPPALAHLAPKPKLEEPEPLLVA